MPVALSTGSLYKWGLKEGLDAAVEAGYQDMEVLWNRSVRNFTAFEVKEWLEERGLCCVSVHSPFESLPGWGLPDEHVLRAIEGAHVLGATLVVLHPPSARLFRGRARKRFAQRMPEYRRAAGDAISLCIENLPVKRRLGLVPYCPYALASFEGIRDFALAHRVHVTFDMAHAATRTTDVLAALGVVRERVRNVHVSDSDGRRQHLLPGQGRVAIENVIRRARLLQPRPQFTVELDPHKLGTDDMAQVVGRLREARVFVERLLEEP